MLVNSYKINVKSIPSGVTATTINIPVSLEYQIVDNAELIDRVFVDTEVIKAINPILDYDTVRFLPKKVTETSIIPNVRYSLSFLPSIVNQTPSKYSDIGFTDADIIFDKNNFKLSFLYLKFYDSDNPLIQNLVTDLTIYNMVNPTDYLPNGNPKPASQIPVVFELNNPILNPRGFSEGYHLYSYKDEYINGEPPKSLYMRAAYNNAKTGTSLNLMTEPVAYHIDQLIGKLFTKYDLYRDSSGYYYQVDPTYSNNIVYNTNNITINLYQIQAL